MAFLLSTPSVLDNQSRVELFGDTSYVTVQGRVVADSHDLAGFTGRDGGVAMTLQKGQTAATRHRSPPAQTPRLRLKPKAPRSGCVDGAWWPHSDDLTVELPDLLAVLSVRLGPIDRVLYPLNEWAKAPKKLPTDERTVRLDGYHRQPTNALEVLGLNRKKIVLLVISPQADPDQAHAIMMTAAGPNNSLTVNSLLTDNAEEH